MNTIEKYFDKNKRNLFFLLDNSKYTKTSRLHLRFYEKIFILSNYINKLDNKTSLYMCSILFRTLTEHFIVMYYIWSKFCDDNNDKIAEKYYNEYYMHEILKRDNYANISKITPGNKSGLIINLLIKKFKDLKIVEQKHIDQIHKSGNEFDIKRISKYIHEEKPDDSFNLVKKDRIKRLLQYYNYLSSFIHGGPSADLLTNETTDQEREASILDLKELTNWMTLVDKIMIIYFLAHENVNIKTDAQSIFEKFLIE